MATTSAADQLHVEVRFGGAGGKRDMLVKMPLGSDLSDLKERIQYLSQIPVSKMGLYAYNKVANDKLGTAFTDFLLPVANLGCSVFVEDACEFPHQADTLLRGVAPSACRRPLSFSLIPNYIGSP